MERGVEPGGRSRKRRGAGPLAIGVLIGLVVVGAFVGWLKFTDSGVRVLCRIQGGTPFAVTGIQLCARTPKEAVCYASGNTNCPP
jgi:hypothetical protein